MQKSYQKAKDKGQIDLEREEIRLLLLAVDCHIL